MRKTWALFCVLLKCSVSLFDIKLGSKERKWAAPLLWGIVAVCMLPTLWIFYTMFLYLFALFQPAGQLAYAAGMVLNIGCLVVFIFSSFSIPAFFYFSRDVEYLLPLPLASTQLIGAKFAVALLFEYIVALFMMGPMYVALLHFVPAVFLTVNALLTFVTLPVLPLIYSTLLIMLLMRLSRFGKNRDRYNMIAGMFVLIFALGFGVASSRFAVIEPDQVMALIEGNGAALGALRSLFPLNVFAGKALAGEGGIAGAFLYQLFNFVFCAAALVLFFQLARLLYFKGVIGISESSSPAKKMTPNEIARNVSSQGVFRSCLQKELRLLFRSPTAFINCVTAPFMIPLIFIVSIFAGSGKLYDYWAVIPRMDFSEPRVVIWALFNGIALGFMVSGMTPITPTAISREGRNFFTMKYIPVSYRTQLKAKAASGLLVMLPALAIMLVILQVVFKAPPLIFAGVALLMLPGSIFLNYFGLLVDLLRPKLIWDNEQLAIKQNLNVLFTILAGLFLWGLTAALGLVLPNVLHTPLAVFLLLLLLTSALAFAAHHFVLRAGEKLMVKLFA